MSKERDVKIDLLAIISVFQQLPIKGTAYLTFKFIRLSAKSGVFKVPFFKSRNPCRVNSWFVCSKNQFLRNEWKYNNANHVLNSCANYSVQIIVIKNWNWSVATWKNAEKKRCWRKRLSVMLCRYVFFLFIHLFVIVWLCICVLFVKMNKPSSFSFRQLATAALQENRHSKRQQKKKLYLIVVTAKLKPRKWENLAIHVYI